MKNPNGFGSIIKLSGSRRKPWTFRITTSLEGGKQHFKYLGYFASKKEALQVQLAYSDGLINVDNNNITFSELFEKYKENKYPDISDSQRNIYDLAYSVAEKFHHRTFKDIRTSEIQSFIKSLDKSYSYKMKMKTLFNQLYELALADDIVAKNYAASVKIGKESVNRKHRTLTEHEMKCLLDHVGDYWIDYLVVLLLTGLRLMELPNIEVSRVYLDKGYMIGGSKTEAGKDRAIPIHPYLVPIIKRHMGEKYLFEWVGKKNTKSTVSKFLKRTKDDLGLSFQNHDLRTTFVSLMTGLGVPKVVIQKIVGHKGDDVTDRAYTDLEIHVLQDAISKLANHKVLVYYLYTTQKNTDESRRINIS